MKAATQLRVQALLAAAVGLVAATTLTLDADSAAVRVRGRLGPTPGPNSLGHVQAKRAYLERIAAADPDRPAAGLVSFSKLVSARDAKGMADGMEVTVVFVRLPQSEPDALHVMDTLSEAVGAGVNELAEVVRAEITSIEAQLRTAQAAEREELNRSLDERREALGSLTADCLCVYAVAVQETTLGALARLQSRAEVALVDVPEPTTDDLAGWELTPLLPGATS
jgi:hypothetical protein